MKKPKSKLCKGKKHELFSWAFWGTTDQVASERCKNCDYIRWNKYPGKIPVYEKDS